MVRPADRREAIEYLEAQYAVSERRSCSVLKTHRSAYRRKPQRDEQTFLRMRIKEIASARVRYWYRRIHVLLLREGWENNHKRVYRLYKEEGLNLRNKTKRKRIRTLTILDMYSRECLNIYIDKSIKGEAVASVLDLLKENRGLPKRIKADNGPEFISRALDAWAYLNDVKLDYSRPGTPTDNAYIESFNGSFCDECLNVNWFMSLEDARDKIESRRKDYNEFRPHSSLTYLTPAEFALKSKAEAV